MRKKIFLENCATLKNIFQNFKFSKKNQNFVFFLPFLIQNKVWRSKSFKGVFIDLCRSKNNGDRAKNQTHILSSVKFAPMAYLGNRVKYRKSTWRIFFLMITNKSNYSLIKIGVGHAQRQVDLTWNYPVAILLEIN